MRCWKERATTDSAPSQRSETTRTKYCGGRGSWMGMAKTSSCGSPDSTCRGGVAEKGGVKIAVWTLYLSYRADSAQVIWITCFFCSRKYSEWYISSLSASSTHTHQGSEWVPWRRSSQSNSGVTSSRTRSTLRVIGWIVAASDREGKLCNTFFTVEPIRTERIM